ncbi:MAG: Crp/Fnr family transcriptional regulator [Usitatibacter sp.]
MLAGCEKVELAFGDVLAEPGQAVSHVIFPTGGFISLLAPMGGPSIIEVALTGSEGMYGISVVLGAESSQVQAVVQGTGPAWRMGSAEFRRELGRVPKLRSGIDLYVHVLMGQLVRSAGCNRFHVVEQRVARWLLMTADRSHASTINMTHELLAHMLGVRRVGVTEAASALQAASLISYTRGVVTILDRKGLERASCSCYRTDLDTYQRYFG